MQSAKEATRLLLCTNGNIGIQKESWSSGETLQINPLSHIVEYLEKIAAACVTASTL
jgi:hypothetical protein